MVTFDNVLRTLVASVESFPDFDRLRACAIVRDLRGRVRLVIEEQLTASFDRPGAERLLRAELGDYFQTPIFATRGKPDETRLANALLQRAKPFQLTYMDRVTGDAKTSHGKWKKYEARLSKNAWLDSGKKDRIWDQGLKSPCITTFFSFKGGVGRTTALAPCAWQLASEGTTVVVIDLDLEAPGAGALLGAQTQRGIVDVLVDRLATGDVDLTDSYAPADALGADAGKVHVFPAGALNENFIEKLARLDYTQVASHADVQQSPIEEALRHVLKKIKADLAPTHIFLDARSGLHDLSALSLLRLAHVDVLLARASEQSYQGFDLTIKTLCRRKGAEHLHPIVVHTMAEGGGTRAADDEQQEFRERSHRTFDEAFYRPNGRQYSINDDSAPHAPLVIPFNTSLVRFGKLEAIQDALFAREYRYLCERIKVLAQPTRAGGDA